MIEQRAQVGGMAAAAHAGKASWWSVLGWAAYLACSWTWCIGMFLPVLLVRDYGVWGFVVFAVPNVVGAGAMGWVLRDGAAERIVEKHRAACVAFSVVTTAFQVYFLGWIPGKLLERLESRTPLEAGWVAIGAVLILVIAAIVSQFVRVRNGVVTVAAVAVLAISVWAGVSLWRGAAGVAWETATAHQLSNPIEGDLVWLAPVCFFGFALCPYLDLTFLRARTSLASSGARGAFTLGFGVLFLAMILITLLVAPLVLGLLGMAPGSTVRWLAIWPLLLHLLLQLGYTIFVHEQETARVKASWIAVLSIVLGFAATWVAVSHLDAQWHGMLVGEIVYRCFMSFYGLVFPAYVWLCMIPTGDGHSGIEGARGRWKLGVLAGVCVVAAPCYWMGFIERVEWWLVPGLGVVLCARLLVGGRVLRRG